MRMSRKPERITRISLMAALTVAGAFIAIPLPFSPVPVTLQLFFTLLSGALMGPVDGAVSQIVYVLLGAIGLPVFSGGRGGLSAMAGPTGGYIVGFILAAWVMGKVSERARRMSVFLLGGAAALLCVYVPGVIWLSYVTGMEITQAIAAGVLPFVALDAGKVAVAVWLTTALRRRGMVFLRRTDQ